MYYIYKKCYDIEGPLDILCGELGGKFKVRISGFIASIPSVIIC